MTDKDDRLGGVHFKRLIGGNIRFLIILCIICSILGAVCVITFKDFFIRDIVIMSVLVMYIVYVIISFVDLMLGWFHRYDKI